MRYRPPWLLKALFAITVQKYSNFSFFPFVGRGLNESETAVKLNRLPRSIRRILQNKLRLKPLGFQKGQDLTLQQKNLGYKQSLDYCLRQLVPIFESFETCTKIVSCRISSSLMRPHLLSSNMSTKKKVGFICQRGYTEVNASE